ncbi:hypothetical protein NON20_13680 [Synechocystis sp. B12]|nr:hypothetical protein NON20_13680 [Synechocystis sp. B12]
MSNDLVDDFIVEGDMLILRSVTGEEEIEDGELVAASIKGARLLSNAITKMALRSYSKPPTTKAYAKN